MQNQKVQIKQVADGTVVVMPDGSEHKLPLGASKTAIDKVVKNYFPKMSQEMMRESMVSSPKAAVPQGDLDTSPSGVIQGVTETGLGLLSSLPAAIGGGWAGIGTGLMQGPEAGAESAQKWQERLTYAPKTAAGQQYTQALGDVTEQYLGEEGLDVLGVPKSAGQQALERTGSPVLATAYETLPAVLELFSGLKGLRTMQGKIKLKTPEGYPTQELQSLLQRYGIDYDVLTPDVKELIPSEVGRSAGGDPNIDPKFIAQQDIQKGGTQEGLSLYDEGLFRAKADPNAKAAMQADIPMQTIQYVKQTTPATRFNMLRMLDNMKKVKKGTDIMAFPSKVVGNVAGDYVDYIGDVVKRTNFKLDLLSKNKLADINIDPQPITNKFAQLLDKYSIGYGSYRSDMPDPVTGEFLTTPRFVDSKGNVRIDFDGSDIQAERGAQRMITDAAELLAKAKSTDAYTFHRLKRQLDGIIDWQKQNNSGLVSDKGRAFVKELRAEVNAQLRDLDPEYAKLNDTLSQGLSALDQLGSAVTRRIENQIRSGEANYDGLGQEMRKIFTNYSSAPDIVEALKTIQDTAKLYAKPSGSEVALFDPANVGVKTPDMNVDLFSLARFGLDLDKVFGSAKGGDFQGRQEAAIESAMGRVMPMSPVAQAADMGLSYWEKTRGKTAEQKRSEIQDDKFNALQQLLIQRGAK